MKDIKLTIDINCPARELFDFTLNPNNTHKWIDFIGKEETNEWPVKAGSIYKNTDINGIARQLSLIDLVDGKTFTMRNNESSYNVRYTFIPKSSNVTEFEYYEWVDSGELDDPFDMSYLNKLKSIVEGQNQPK